MNWQTLKGVCSYIDCDIIVQSAEHLKPLKGQFCQKWKSCPYLGYVYRTMIYYRTERFLLIFFWDDNVVKTIPSSHWSMQKTKTLYYAFQASSWRCHFIKLAHEHIMRMRVMSVYSQICFFIVYVETIIWLFPKTCNLKPVFKSLHFQAPKTPLLCKLSHKKFSVFTWKQCLLNGP